jgi:hypothetical protein
MGVQAKVVDYSGHARQRMEQRFITESEVECTIRDPLGREPGNTDYTMRFERDFPPAKRLVVIAERIMDDHYKVVTTYWT